MVVTIVVMGVLLVLAFLERQQLRRDYREIVNEWSIRTGGRIIHREPMKQIEMVEQPDAGQFEIMTPSMVEADAELEENDLEHLRATGVIH